MINPVSHQLYLALFLLWTVTACSPDTGEVSLPDKPSSQKCSQQDQGLLSSVDVEPISLSAKTVSISGIINSNNSKGYSFEGKSGYELKYSTEDDICLWIYTPENELLETTVLPKTGKYVVQVSVPQGSKSFDIDMSLSFHFNKTEFPKPECGDPKPTDPNAYPVKFYPVNTPYSSANLVKARSSFCEDAFQKRDKNTGDKMIQIVSFIDKEKAISFARFVATEIEGAYVGSPTILEK